MHVLVTGGTGFIGQALSPLLLDSGHSLTLLSRSPARAARDFPQARVIEQLVQCDQADAVINLAGEPLADGRWSARRKQDFRDSRIGTTEDLLAWIEAQPAGQRPKAMVSGSAIGYYGARNDRALDEQAPPGDDFAAMLCRDWEAVAQRAEGMGLRVARLRIGVVLDRQGGALARMLPPFRMGAGGPMGDGFQWMSWVHRHDLARLLVWLLERSEASGAYNGTAPTPVRNREFASTLGKVLKRPALLTTPAIALKLLFGEMSTLLLSGQRVVPKRALAEGFEFQYPQLEPALRAILEDHH